MYVCMYVYVNVSKTMSFHKHREEKKISITTEKKSETFSNLKLK